MGNKSVCFNCRKSFSFFKTETHKVCPECKGEVFIYPHRFRTPKKEDINKWNVVRYLKEHGFFYQHISKQYEYIDSNGIAIICSGYEKIPETVREAKEFIEEYSKPKIDLQLESNL